MKRPDFVYRATSVAWLTRQEEDDYLDEFHRTIKWWIVPPRRRTTVHFKSQRLKFYQWPWMLFGNYQFSRSYGRVLVYGSRNPIVSIKSKLKFVEFSNTGGGSVCLGDHRVRANDNPEELFFTTRFTNGCIAPQLDSVYFCKNPTIENITRIMIPDAILIGKRK